MDIAELEFTIRTTNILSANNITTIEQLCEVTLEDLTALKGMGKRSISEIRIMLFKLGFFLKNDYKFARENAVQIRDHVAEDVESIGKHLRYARDYISHVVYKLNEMEEMLSNLRRVVSYKVEEDKEN